MSLRRACVALALFAGAAAAAAQPYPSKPVRMIVPYAAGGPLDTLARIFADKMQQGLAQPMVIEAKPGANGNIGGELVARAAPDGYTLLWVIDTAMTVNPALYAGSMKFDPQKDLAPVSLVSSSDSVLVVAPGVPAKSVRDVVELAKRQSLAFSSGGNGTPAHLAAALLMREAGIDMTHVPYKGNAPSVASLLGGETQLSIASIPGVMPQIRAGRLRAIAVTGSKRTPFLAEVPTFVESGYPNIVIEGWRALLAPAGTPRAVIDVLQTEVVRVSKLPDVIEKLAAIGTAAVASTPERLAQVMREETRLWTRVVKESNMTVQ
ncbi:MAG: tripartite tricarboxylate transporter substrate binding protein [Betaproteobacteria bacterium]|nr:tripartite tricarboxylate transporter substrate binding protein [Betaproteobacteria bacterium]